MGEARWRAGIAHAAISLSETVPDTLASLTGNLNEQRDLSRDEELKAGFGYEL